MTSLTAAGRQLAAASGLSAVLNSAYDAFECLLMAFRAVDDPSSSMFAAFVMSAALAADGRDAIAFAPSLPPAAMDWGIAAMAAEDRASASELADLCRDLVMSLERVAETASNPDDGAACRDAIRCARGIHFSLPVASRDYRPPDIRGLPGFGSWSSASWPGRARSGRGGRK